MDNDYWDAFSAIPKKEKVIPVEKYRDNIIEIVKDGLDYFDWSDMIEGDILNVLIKLCNFVKKHPNWAIGENDKI